MKSQKIIEACLNEKGTDPIDIFNRIAAMDFIAMHGPEHHILDGAALLTAYHNAGGKIDLAAALSEIANRGSRMPGATCGHWGVCGAVTSMGAALSIIDGTGPVSTDASWGKHMEFTSVALAGLAKTGGPRCCKRDAYISFETAVRHINENYDVELKISDVRCGFSEKNAQCIKDRCPYFPRPKVAFICVHNSCRSQIAEALDFKIRFL